MMFSEGEKKNVVRYKEDRLKEIKKGLNQVIGR